jgi:hypothetical protein
MDGLFVLGAGPQQKIFDKVFSGVKKEFMNVKTVKELMGARKI